MNLPRSFENWVNKSGQPTYLTSLSPKWLLLLISPVRHTKHINPVLKFDWLLARQSNETRIKMNPDQYPVAINRPNRTTANFASRFCSCGKLGIFISCLFLLLNLCPCPLCYFCISLGQVCFYRQYDGAANDNYNYKCQAFLGGLNFDNIFIKSTTCHCRFLPSRHPNDDAENGAWSLNNNVVVQTWC